MLTPIDIQSKVFKSGGMGYNKQDVDLFFSTVAAIMKHYTKIIFP